MTSLQAVQVFDEKINASIVNLQTRQEIPDKYIDNYGCVCVNGVDNGFRQRLPVALPNNNLTFNAIADFLKNYITISNDIYFTVKKIHRTSNFTICSVTLYSTLNDHLELKIKLIPTQGDFFPKKWYDNCQILNHEEDGTYKLIKSKRPFSYTTAFTFSEESDRIPVVQTEDYIFVDSIAYKKTHEIPTFHTFAYSGFFKPTLPEVYMQMPSDFNQNNKFLLSTNLISSEPHICVQGNYHVAITTIWVEE